MFERKDNKKEALLDLDGRMANLNKRYTAVKDAGLKIQSMVMVRSCPGGPWRGHGLSAAGEGGGRARGFRKRQVSKTFNPGVRSYSSRPC